MRLEVLLARSGVPLLRYGRLKYVPLADLEEKLRPLWDGIKAAEMLRSMVAEE